MCGHNKVLKIYLNPDIAILAMTLGLCCELFESIYYLIASDVWQLASDVWQPPCNEWIPVTFDFRGSLEIFSSLLVPCVELQHTM